MKILAADLVLWAAPGWPYGWGSVVNHRAPGTGTPLLFGDNDPQVADQGLLFGDGRVERMGAGYYAGPLVTSSPGGGGNWGVCSAPWAGLFWFWEGSE